MLLIIVFNSFDLISGNAFRIFFSILFFGLKKGPKILKRKLDKFDEIFNPKILKIKKRKKIIKNWKKYFIVFIFLTL
tara:strand:+ start:653 stop:883 length:231 start_codon:yes stop_codon:yes gene_type:complete